MELRRERSQTDVNECGKRNSQGGTSEYSDRGTLNQKDS